MRKKTVENSFPLLVVTTDNFTAMKKRIKTVENSFPLLVVKQTTSQQCGRKNDLVRIRILTFKV
jgi:hypothetical protein